jgi:hypothetical protein
MRYRSPKIYQYTEMEKIKLCLEDEDFYKYIKRQFGSLRKREDLMDCIQEIKPDYTLK